MLKLAPDAQLEIVDAAFHGHDPAVQEVSRAYELATEVVDEEAAAQCLHVQRRFIVMPLLVVAQVQHVQSQFASGHNERPPASDPAFVARVAQEARGFRPRIVLRWKIRPEMKPWIEKADDLAFNGDCIRHMDHILKDAGETERD